MHQTINDIDTRDRIVQFKIKRTLEFHLLLLKNIQSIVLNTASGQKSHLLPLSHY